MDFKTKLILFISGTIIAILMGLLIVKEYQFSQQQKEFQNSVLEMKHLQDEIIRSKTEYVSKEDLESFSKSLNLNLDIIKKDLASLDAKVQGINVAVVSTPGYHGSGLPSTGTNPKPPDSTGTKPSEFKDEFGYWKNEQKLALKEPINSEMSVPLGEVSFKAWEPKPWGLEIFPRKYSVITVLGQDASGRHYTYNKFNVETEGKTYEIPITDSKFIEQKPESQFLINPRLHLALSGGVIVNPSPKPEFTPNVQVSIFSYGQTSDIEDTQWSFLGVGLGLETQELKPALIISPLKYNLGYNIPYIEYPKVSEAIASHYSHLKYLGKNY